MNPKISLAEFYASITPDGSPPVVLPGHFDIVRVEDLATGTELTNKYARRDYWKISLVNGQSIIRYPDISFEIEADALVFTNPDMPYKWDRLSAEQSGYVCIFTNDFLAQFGNLSNYPIFNASNSVILLDRIEADQFQSIFKKLKGLLSDDYSQKYELIKCLLMEIIHEAQRRLPVGLAVNHYGSANERIRDLFLQAVEKEIAVIDTNKRVSMRSPATFAASLHMHVNHLNKVLKIATGHTTSELIDMRMLLEAKLLLLNTSLSIKEVAWSLGFDESNHFSAFFKRFQGVTPTAFRNSRND